MNYRVIAAALQHKTKKSAEVKIIRNIKFRNWDNIVSAPTINLKKARRNKHK